MVFVGDPAEEGRAGAMRSKRAGRAKSLGQPVIPPIARKEELGTPSLALNGKAKGFLYQVVS